MDLYVIRRPGAWATPASSRPPPPSRQVGNEPDVRPGPMDPQLRGEGSRQPARHRLPLRSERFRGIASMHAASACPATRSFRFSTRSSSAPTRPRPKPDRSERRSGSHDVQTPIAAAVDLATVKGASRSPGAPATTPSSAPPADRPARRCARPSTCAATSAARRRGRQWQCDARRRAALRRGRLHRLCRRADSSAERSAPRRAPRVTFQEADAGCSAVPGARDLRRRALDLRRDVHAESGRKAAAEMLRVCRPGGKIGLSQLDAGQLHRLLSSHRQVPAPGAPA